jgi:hypothetical protein
MAFAAGASQPRKLALDRLMLNLQLRQSVAELPIYRL